MMFRQCYRSYVVLVLFCLTLAPLSAFAQERPPVLPALGPGEDLSTAMSNYAFDLQMFFDMQGANYSVATGIRPVTQRGQGSKVAIIDLQLAYKSALLQAYSDLASQLDPDGVDITTTDTVNGQMSEGDALKDSLIAQCKDDASVAHDKHKRKIERKQAKRLEEESSLSSQFFNAIKSDEVLEAERAERERVISPPQEPDFIFTCEAPGDTYVQASTVQESISDSLSGGRIWASYLHEGQLAVVLVRSGDTAEVAAVLKNQMAPANPNTAALREVSERIHKEMDAYPGMPMGIVGTRMMRLSNGEWALYAFGAAQEEKKPTSSMGALKKSMSGNKANTQALAELSRFSGLMINKDIATTQIKTDGKSFVIEVNVTRDTHKFTTKQDPSLGEVINFSFSGKSDLQLVGAQAVFNQLFETNDGMSYRLQAVAWSPSIMAGNLQKRASQDAQAENAARNGQYVPKDQLMGAKRENGSGEGSEPAILNTDW